MAKRRQCEAADGDTKKPKQVLKAKKKDSANGITESEESPVRKVKPKPRPSTKQAGRNTAGKTSKYFQSPVKAEEGDRTVGFSTVTPAPSALTAKKTETEQEEDSEEDEDDWEEVEELDEPLGPKGPSEPVIPSEPVQIEIETQEVRKKKKRQAEFETYLRRMMNRYQKDQWEDTHKVHLMCLIANGMFRNRLCSEPDLLAITLSLLPTHFGNVAKERIDQNYLSGMHKWFRATFTLNPDLPYEERPDPRALLERRLASLSARNHQEMTHLFLLFLRSVMLFCRLVISLQPVPLKAPSAKGKGAKADTGGPGKSDAGQKTEPKVSGGTKRPSGGSKSRGGKKAKGKGVKEEDGGGGDDEEEEETKPVTSGGQRPKNTKRRSVASKVSYKDESNSGEETDEEALGGDDEDFHATGDEDSGDSDSQAKSKTKNKGKAPPKRRSSGGTKQPAGGGEDVKDVKESPSGGSKRRSAKEKGPGANEWLEVFLDKAGGWVCVDVEHGVGKPQLCSKSATAPLTYVLSVDGDGFVKDLGRKYDPTWMTSSRKRRVDEEWWEETLEPFMGPEDERDAKEDKELQNKLLNKPLPVSVAEYKNHPLYALKRHLLKYEAIYPPTATILGYCRGEPVYSRDCIHTLHSKDTWLKEARTVRLAEEPFKMVRGFSNRSRKARMMTEQKEQNDLALFGEWQTEEYQPPLAVDGKVPRNDYGNVYLFKPCMLPVGCVHVRLPNLHRVAKKLDLDAAPAVTGFDFHGGYSHAVTDGYIVCEEHEEVLRAAWSEDQELQKQKEREKREKRVIANWTLLVKGLLIRERLRQRYSKKNHALAQGDEGAAGGLSSDEEATAEGGSHGAKSASETLAMSWPQNRQAAEEDAGSSALKKKTATKRDKRGQEKHMFPFEKA